MRLMRTVVFALVALAVVAASTASAQTPYIGVFFDKTGIAMSKDCPGGGATLQQLFFILYNTNRNVSAVEFKVVYPPELLWLADQDFPTPDILAPIDRKGTTFGVTPTGVSAAWALPQNGFFPIIIGSALVQWQCSICTVPNSPIDVMGHPLFSVDPRWVDFETNNLHDAIGLRSLVCAIVPVEETTWGRVKSLYTQ